MNLLEAKDLAAGYGDFQALTGIDLQVGGSEVVAIIGVNGAGKTTLLCALVGQLRSSAGSLQFHGQNIAGWDVHRVAAAGVATVPEGRKLFLATKGGPPAVPGRQ